MKSKLIFLAIGLVAIFSMTSCKDENYSNASIDRNNNGIVPSIVNLGNNGYGAGCYYYSIDRNTGVVYLEYDATYRHAITVMLNPDGTPVTAKQIGVKGYNYDK